MEEYVYRESVIYDCVYLNDPESYRIVVVVARIIVDNEILSIDMRSYAL